MPTCYSPFGFAGRQSAVLTWHLGGSYESSRKSAWIDPPGGSIAAGVFLLRRESSAIASAPAGGVDAKSIEDWKAFRAAQPFQTQVIAVSPPDTTQKTRTLIFADPPPTLSLERLIRILEPHVAGCTVQKWFVMSGGSIKDAVCTLRKGAAEDWPDKLAQLQIEAYGTAEAAPVVALPAPKRSMIAHSLDLKFSANDLHAWLTDGNQGFRSSAIGPSVPLHALLDRGVRGVFWNSDRTLVLWAFDRGGSLAGAQADIRRFAVGSDLVLGAIAGKSTVVMVGRGRVESLAHVPPLRSETILLLAGTEANQARPVL